MNTVIMVGRSVLLAVYRRVVGATAISADIKSEPKMNKRGNPFFGIGVTKSVTLSGIIGGQYSNAVNNQLGREDKGLDFVAQVPTWFRYVEGSNIIGRNKNDIRGDETDALYFAMKVQTSTKPVYRYADGRIIATDEIKPFLQKSSAPKTQADLEKKVIWRTPKFASVQSIRMGGTEFVILEGAIEVSAAIVEAAQVQGEHDLVDMVRQGVADTAFIEDED
jgi:hypothetical protein